MRQQYDDGRREGAMVMMLLKRFAAFFIQKKKKILGYFENETAVEVAGCRLQGTRRTECVLTELARAYILHTRK